MVICKDAAVGVFAFPQVHHGLSSAKAQTLLGQPLPRLVYDGCLQHVYCDGTRGAWAVGRGGLACGGFCCAFGGRVVLPLAGCV